MALDPAVLADLDRFGDRAAAAAAEPIEDALPVLPFRSAREIAAATPEQIEWVARPWAAAGAITELDGKVKSAGKTTFVSHLIGAVLDGEPFLGRPTLRSPVVFLTEQTERSLRETLRRADLLGRDDLRVLCWHQARALLWPDVAAAAAAEAHRIGAKLLVVDTLSQWAGVRGDDENLTGPALAAMEPLQAAAAAGLAVIVLRHDRKSGGEVGDSGRGASAFAGVVDVVLQLSRPPGQGRPTLRQLAALSRFDETPAKLVIELTDAGYVALGTDPAVAAAEARDAVLRVAPGTEDDAITEDALLEKAGVKRTVGQEAVKEHVAAGRLRRAGAGKRGDPYRYWAPPGGSPPGSDEKVSAGAPPVPAESNGAAGRRRGGGEKVSATLKGRVPAESNRPGSPAGSGSAGDGTAPDRPVAGAGEKASAGTPVLGAADSNRDGGGSDPGLAVASGGRAVTGVTAGPGRGGGRDPPTRTTDRRRDERERRPRRWTTSTRTSPK